MLEKDSRFTPCRRKTKSLDSSRHAFSRHPSTSGMKNTYAQVRTAFPLFMLLFSSLPSPCPASLLVSFHFFPSSSSALVCTFGLLPAFLARLCSLFPLLRRSSPHISALALYSLCDLNPPQSSSYLKPFSSFTVPFEISSFTVPFEISSLIVFLKGALLPSLSHCHLTCLPPPCPPLLYRKPLPFSHEL